MKKFLFVVFLSILCLTCDSQQKEYTFEELRNEFKESFNIDDKPIGTRFWDEFGNFESQYKLTEEESKLLGRWINVTFATDPSYHDYAFLPNKLFISRLKSRNFKIIGDEKVFFNKALGTWEIANGVVRITIYAIITQDTKLGYPDNKGLFFVEKPYSVDFIKIKDIDEWGFTKIPVNDKILSKELLRKVIVLQKNESNNLYVRNIYTIDHAIGAKDYNYFDTVPEMARDNVSGLDVATNPELIRKYISNWWF